MRPIITAVMVVTGTLCLLLGELAAAAVTMTSHVSYALRPCSTCREVAYPTEKACREAAIGEATRAGPTRTTGSAVYTCLSRYNVIATFGANPVTCPAPPAASKRPQPCPAGTVGSWEQLSQSTVGPAPQCAVVTVWSPATAPVNACLPPLPSGTAALTWTAPTQNTNGSALTNLFGFRISYGTSPTALTQTRQLANAAATQITITGLSPGTYYFAVRAYTSVGTESEGSNIALKVIQ